MRNGLTCAWGRNAAVLVWTPVLLLGPVLDLHGSVGSRAFQLFLVVVIAGCAAVIAVVGARSDPAPHAYVALSTMLAATFAAATHHDSQWLPTWVLLANAVPAVIRGRRLLLAVPLVAALSMWAAWMVQPHQASRVWTEGFVVLLAGAANSAFTALLDTVAELRRTRQELARVAVVEERERFSRDLHDLLGHSLSVMVVKAQVVRRLIDTDTDPGAAATHAGDIEQIGRRALVDVRQAVDAMAAPKLVDELTQVRRALDDVGITTTVDWSGDPPSGKADEVLGWVLREAATNVLRHSGANRCRIELTEHDGRTTLSVLDDGVGGPIALATRIGGLTGLRDRLAAVGGDLAVESPGAGFELVASVPGGHR